MSPNILFSILEVLKISIPCLFIFLTAFYLWRNTARKDVELRLLELKMNSNKETLLLKLQAYERLALLLERISPHAVIMRVRMPEMLAPEMQYAMVRNIRDEFEHNLSQQVYVSSASWNLIVASKDETIKAINMISMQVSPESSANELAKIILDSIANSGAELPTAHALEYLKAEVRELIG